MSHRSSGEGGEDFGIGILFQNNILFFCIVFTISKVIWNEWVFLPCDVSLLPCCESGSGWRKSVLKKGLQRK